MDIGRMKFVQFMEMERIERLYTRLSAIELNSLEPKDYYYIKGALDSLFSIIGCQNHLTRLIDLDDELFASEEDVSALINGATDHFMALLSNLQEEKDNDLTDPISNAGEIPEGKTNTAKETSD